MSSDWLGSGLHALAAELVEKETLSGVQIRELLVRLVMEANCRLGWASRLLGESMQPPTQLQPTPPHPNPKTPGVKHTPLSQSFINQPTS